ncbi:MAG: hypothetical protein Q9204_000841 [Flavoplaca sp. TL-2023a]
MAGCSRAELQYMINHVVLPPKLPDRPEPEDFVEATEKTLLDEIQSVLRRFVEQCTPEVKPAWITVQRMLSRCANAKIRNDLSEKTLTEAISDMRPGATGLSQPDSLPIRIRAQNAAIIFRRVGEDITLECFEVSPPAPDVIGCKGSLRRTFPAHAVAIPPKIATNGTFCCELFTMLRKFEIEVVHEMMPKSRKAGQDWSEFRDTCHPGLVSELLMATLAAIGTPVETLQIQKRIRDDVVWGHTKLPWRRSTLWLTLRVSIHTSLARSMEPAQAHKQFKNFTVYFLTNLLDLAMNLKFGPDMCKCLQMKIARRVIKLGTGVLSFVQENARMQINKMTERQYILQQELQKKDAARPTDIDLSTIEQYTCLTLLKSRAALDTALFQSQHDMHLSAMSPSEHCEWLTFKTDGFAYVNEAIQLRSEKIYAMAEYERWMEESLTDWMEKALRKPTATHCTSISKSARYYKEWASELYKGSPEHLSVMLLTLGDLWYALDRIACSMVPLMHRYSPEISANVFDVLLLPRLVQMQRLQRLQLHIEAREHKTQFGSIFAGTNDCNAFSYQYFDQSPELQELRGKIIADAVTHKEQKQREWQTKTTKYNDLTTEMDSMQCSTMTDSDDENVHDDTKCRKCELQTKIQSISIPIFEWPLPESQTQSRLAIFHLCCPEFFVAWQNLTWMLTHDLGRESNTAGATTEDHLFAYNGLHPYYKNKGSCLTLASSLKSVSATHYREFNFPIAWDQVFSKNGLHWRLYDKVNLCWVDQQQERPVYTSRCRVALPEGPYQQLQFAVNSTSHSQNEILAVQTECSPDLSIHEYIAFGSLRADGERTQWLNICRELRAPTLTWNTESVCSLLRQTAWEAGSSGTTTLRNTHGVFHSLHFTAELLSNLEKMLESIRGNRQCHYAMEIVIILALRTLSLTDAKDTRTQSLRLLQNCRVATFHWVAGLEPALRAITDPAESKKLRHRLLRAGILCKMTLDVGKDLGHLSMATSEDLTFWTAASMTVQANTPGFDDLLPKDLQRLLLGDARLNQALYDRVKRLSSETACMSVSLAVSRIWSAFDSTTDSWEYPKQWDDRWVSKRTAAALNGKPQKVSYNLLSGELLIDERPLGMLPRSYTAHKTFVRLFGEAVFRVSASDMGGMLYMTAEELHGHHYYFCMTGRDLVIKAKCASKITQIIPHEHFVDDLPTMLVEECAHWLDLGTCVVELRPLTRKFTTDSRNWRLFYQKSGKSYLQNTSARLVDIRSRTCQNTVDVLGCLETKPFMHITQSFDGQFQVFLPRLGFHFFKNSKGAMECQELRKIIDNDQSLGTLIGLRSRLILCAQGERSRKLDRVVLVPQGTVSTEIDGSHIAVHITASKRNVHCFRFRHDSILRGLEGDANLISKLYQVYLHALTSLVVPDPFTGYMGVEQSIKILGEQIVRCGKPLDHAEMELLNLIAQLTPRRIFYPDHLEAMQIVTWHKHISSLLQHAAFSAIAQKIVAQSEQFHHFYQDVQSVPELDTRGDIHLLQRARIRNSGFMNVDFGGNGCTTQHDQDYDSRDLDCNLDKIGRVYSMSSFVKSWTGDMIIRSDLATIWTTWGLVAGFEADFDLSMSVADLLTLDLGRSWGSLYRFCRTATPESSRYKLLFLFAQLSYGSKISSLNDLKTLLAFATNPSLRQLSDFPSYRFFNLGRGSQSNAVMLRTAIDASVKPFEVSNSRLSASERRKERAAYKRLSEANVNAATDFYQDREACPQQTTSYKWLNNTALEQSVAKLFAEWSQNRECLGHLAKIRSAIDSTMTSPIQFSFPSDLWQRIVVIPRVDCSGSIPTASFLMDARFPDIPRLPPLFRDQQEMKPSATDTELRSLVTGFGAKKIQSILCSEYKAELLASCDALQKHQQALLPCEIASKSVSKVMSLLDRSYEVCEQEFNCLCRNLQPIGPTEDLSKAADLWPRLSVGNLLALIATTSAARIPEAWKDSIMTFGVGITILQRYRRLVLAAEKGDAVSFHQEMANPGHYGWHALERPDWLLIEIENDLLIRPIQVRVAMEMIAPSRSTNTLMQLNMGEGKSSVITPLIAATLADTSRLVRVVVLRSLTRQMQDTLTQKLSGLVNRPVYFMPFSRKTHLDDTVVDQMQSMYADCMAKGGIIIAQPEHILSFKLMGIERITSGDCRLGAALMKTQAWLENHCRDILDESDEILDVKFQLIYTVGAQRDMDGKPDRWLLMQAVFDIVQNQAWLLQTEFADHIELEKRTSGSFPSIRLLSMDIRKMLIRRVSGAICESKVPGLVMSNLPREVSEAAANFITLEDVSNADCKTVKMYFSQDEDYLKKLLFVRGLIACGILLHVLHDKRWSVTYGLDLTRCLCAVPYRARGVPAPTAEFGHPDISIALTCLSYYYTGLTNDQLRASLEILQKADDPSLEYGAWIKEDNSIPVHLQHWNAVSLEDHQQCDEQLFPALRFNKKVADFFITNVVFPKEGKEFDQKLSTSGWDIPARSDSRRITTGFSGTNDNRFLLPSSISQHDLPELRHTSAKVLAFLLKPENLSYTCAMDDKGRQVSSQGLLECIMRVDSSVRVLIDVGAQILNLSNEDVVAHWLTLDVDADAGVFFSSGDHPMVLDRKGNQEALATSSFASRMDRCVVYLDDVHTRACMRLRQLGQGQSLLYVAPPEVHHNIVATSATLPTGEITGRSVIEWALEQSCLQIERNQLLRVIQGLSYHNRQGALDVLKERLSALVGDEETSVKGLGEDMIEHEAQSLHDLYAPDAMREGTDSDLVRNSRSKSDQGVQELVAMWDQINPRASRNANMHEELEREVGHEVEQETQIERPPRADPEERKVDSRLMKYIRFGIDPRFTHFPSVQRDVLPLSATFRLLNGRKVPWESIHVTTDFIKTVKHSTTSGIMDDYHRPVHWLLVPKALVVQDAVLLISQYEVNQCLNQIQAPTSRVTLISYQPRVSRSMPSIDSSPIDSLPGASRAWNDLEETLRQELHLFAGQLYFTTFAEYELLAESLATRDATPLNFIKEWIGIRRKGQNYLQTHVGQVVSGGVLHEEMFDAEDEEVLHEEMSDIEDEDVVMSDDD